MGCRSPWTSTGSHFVATGIAPALGHTFQGESASILKLDFDPVDTDVSTRIRLNSVKVHQVGSPWTGDTNLNTGGVVLYEDTNTNDAYDSGTDMQIASASLSSGMATVTPTTPATIPSTGKTFFVVVNISLTAVVNDEVELQIDDPATDITFSDAYADDLAGAEYAYVPSGYAYTQKGYIITTPPAATPTTGNATIIDLQTTPPRPIVSSIVPGNNAAGVERSIAIVATFSKNMETASLSTSTFKLFNGATEIPGGVTFDGTITATFTPTLPLDWGTTYTVRVIGGATGVKATVAPTDMEFDKVWSFTTEFAVYPTVLSTGPLNAQIEVPRTTAVTATFSKDMNEAAVETPGVFTVSDGTSYVSGSVSYNPASRTATFSQTSPPSSGARCTRPASRPTRKTRMAFTCSLRTPGTSRPARRSTLSWRSPRRPTASRKCRGRGTSRRRSRRRCTPRR